VGDPVSRIDDAPNAAEASSANAAEGQPISNSDDASPQLYTRWYVRNGKFRPVGSTVERLPGGIYEADNDNDGLYLEEIDFPADALLKLPGTPVEYILKQIDNFWAKEAIFKECGFLHKRGILLYGPAGCGKTSIIKLLCEQLIKEHDGVVIYITNVQLSSQALADIRAVEPERKILTIIEDIEEYTESSNSRPRQLLALLDGEEQIDHVVHLATTNKPEVLEDRIVKRPGRFDLVIGLNPPVAEARYQYMKNIVKESMSEEQLQKLTKKTAGLGLAHLRELIVATHCLELDLEETLERLQNNQKKAPKIKKEGAHEVGFTVNFFQNTGVLPSLDD
jgi:energy-coupling factor transporter ATP-binding protein EcfA2